MGIYVCAKGEQPKALSFLSIFLTTFISHFRSQLSCTFLWTAFSELPRLGEALQLCVPTAACTASITALLTLNCNYLWHCLWSPLPHCDFCGSRDFPCLCHSQHNTYLLSHYINSIDDVLWERRWKRSFEAQEKGFQLVLRDKLRIRGEMIWFYWG